MTPTEWDQEHARLTAALQALGERPEGESVCWVTAGSKYRGSFAKGMHEVLHSNGYIETFSCVAGIANEHNIPDDATLTDLLALNPESEVAKLRAFHDESQAQLDHWKSKRDLWVERERKAQAQVRELGGQIEIAKENAASADRVARKFCEERDTLVVILATEFGWSDTSFLHAVMHVKNAVRNMKADTETLAAELDAIKAQEPCGWMLIRDAGCEVKVPVYRRPVAEARAVEPIITPITPGGA